MSEIILASASPRRIELIKTICENAVNIDADIDESVPCGIELLNYAEYIACKKAEKVAGENRDAFVIGCDTVVIINGEILGKPHDEEDAERMLRMLSGRLHTVVTGCCICFNEEKVSFSETTQVEFSELSDEVIKEYVKTGEPLDKAGAYGIQGKGALIVKGIKGDYYNVMGLPLSRLNRELTAFKDKVHSV